MNRKKPIAIWFLVIKKQIKWKTEVTFTNWSLSKVLFGNSNLFSSKAHWCNCYLMIVSSSARCCLSLSLGRSVLHIWAFPLLFSQSSSQCFGVLQYKNYNLYLFNFLYCHFFYLYYKTRKKKRKRKRLRTYLINLTIYKY